MRNNICSKTSVTIIHVTVHHMIYSNLLFDHGELSSNQHKLATVLKNKGQNLKSESKRLHALNACVDCHLIPLNKYVNILNFWHLINHEHHCVVTVNPPWKLRL